MKAWRKSLICVMLLVFIGLLAFGVWIPSNSNAKAQTGGSLVIVGGALSDTNAAVYNKIIQLAGGANSVIGVIPVNSADPYGSYDFYRNLFLSYGAGNVVLIDITIDNYATNAYSQQIVNTINSCTGIWFTGGDQMRAVTALYDSSGNMTPALQAIWNVYNNGGVIAGSSAGAALMSNPMIIGGESFDALRYGSSWGPTLGNGVTLYRGLGFFSGGLVDQHFHARGRIGRLIRAAWDYYFDLAFGIDEDTAMVVQGNTITALGKRGITIIDLTNAYRDYSYRNFSLLGIKMHYISKGDTFNLSTKNITPNPVKINLRGNEYYSGTIYTNAVFDPYTAYDCFVKLVDSKTEIYAIGEKYDKKAKLGFRLRWDRYSDTYGYWQRIDGDSSYTVINEYLKITPY
ncbi:cyanophycinase [Thermovenabulum gondwanense]|uniref:Cyanophycinase n=1 Tax=Thermovenabulum gondwanense TaxID=520767 RepID=A0A161PSV4_9FIRM|nr:cyanophycinase [Thermovenabulum gondwanense]KYO64337.1 Cyanophycinase [Thermovenabulum gondwanense]